METKACSLTVIDGLTLVNKYIIGTFVLPQCFYTTKVDAFDFCMSQVRNVKRQKHFELVCVKGKAAQRTGDRKSVV